MTKYVANNTPIQVSSNLIGVRVLSGDGEDVNCIVSYSVDGGEWTFATSKLTEYNNVIGNIPRYMYLKFSQDVVITVE